MKAAVTITILLTLLVPLPLPAETLPEVDVDQVFMEKRAVVKEFMQLTEKESAVFWPLYDEYDKSLMDRFNRYRALIREYLQVHKNLSDKKAEEMAITLMDLQADELKGKQAYFKKFRAKLPAKRVFQYFVLEDQIEAGFFSVILENLPPIK